MPDEVGVKPICAVLADHGIKIAPNTCWAYIKRDFRPTVPNSVTLMGPTSFNLWVTTRRAGKAWGRDRFER